MYRQAFGSRPTHLNLCEDLNVPQDVQTTNDSRHLGETQQEATLSNPGPEVDSTLKPSTETSLQSGSLIPPEYPCIKPLEDLEKILLKDLVFESHHRGFYLLARTITAPVFSKLVSAVIEDEEGDRIHVLLSHQPTKLSLGNGFEKGTLFVVKEPYLKWMDNGHCGIRVDHPSDVKYLSPYDELMPEEWREEHMKHPTIHTWKAKGDCYSEEGKGRLAIECYSKALECPATEKEANQIKFLRSLSYFNLGCFDAVLSELDSLPTDPEFYEKALAYKSEALYNLQRYRECTDILKLCLKEHPRNSHAKTLFSRAIGRLLEQEHGKYKFKQMQHDSEKKAPPIMDCATYMGPVKIEQTDSRGRGVFTTTAVKAGDLLLCEKAFAYTFATSTKSDQEQKTAIPTMETFKAAQRQAHNMLARQATNIVFQNPSLLPILKDFYHGSYTPLETSSVDGAPIVDMFLVHRIVALNGLGCSGSSRQCQQDLSIEQNKCSIEEQLGTGGLWPFASHINHSCWGNTWRSFIGDMLVLRAATDIPANTELTFCYRVPELDSVKGEPDFSNWGFKCDCPICNNIQSTDDNVLAERLRLRARVADYAKDPRRLKFSKLNVDIVNIERTYSEPAFRMPRRSLWDIYFAIARSYARVGWSLHTIEFSIKALASLGFLITGGGVYGSPPGEIFVQRWGLMVQAAVDIWMMLSRAYQLVEPKFERKAKKYAKLAYKILVGEDETFEETYEKKASSADGPTLVGLITELKEMGVPFDANELQQRFLAGA